MRKLEFIGTVRSNPGNLTEVTVLPGRDRLFLAPADWPTKLAPGTLNIVVNEDGFPEGFAEIGKGDGLQKLDEGRFRPGLVIPQRKIAGNTLKPDVDHSNERICLGMAGGTPSDCHQPSGDVLDVANHRVGHGIANRTCSRRASSEPPESSRGHGGQGYGV